MRPKYVAMIVSGVALVIGAAFLVMQMTDGTPVYSVEDRGEIREVRFLHNTTIVDVSVVPEKDRLHIAVYYDTGKCRHIDLDTGGRQLNIYAVSIKPIFIDRGFVDRSGALWSVGHIEPVRPIPETMYGRFVYTPQTESCHFLWHSSETLPLIHGTWVRNRQ